MEKEKKPDSFRVAASHLPENIAATLMNISAVDRGRIHEIRLRVNSPLSVCIGTASYFVLKNGKLSAMPTGETIVQRNDMLLAVKTLCGYSIHTHFDEMKQGYISLKGGSRAGICGTAVLDSSQITAVTEITSINLRIAREIKGCAKKFMSLFTDSYAGGVLIVGAPGSGKTTLLRDISRMLAGGETGKYHKVAIVDERGEIGAVCGGEVSCDVGICTDLLFGYPKDIGITYAVRTMSPQFVICDEIATRAELEAVLYSLNSGVSMITTVHASSIHELLHRKIGKELMQSGAFGWIVVLKSADTPCEIKHIYSCEEALNCELSV